MSISWVFFDVGYTLVDEDGSHAARLAEAADDIQNACGRSVAYPEFRRLMDEGGMKHSNSPFYYALRKLGVHKKYDYSTDYEIPYSDAAELLEQLSQKYKVGIIANQLANLPERLKARGLACQLDAVFGSDDIGFKKPDTALYLHALSSVGCAPGEAVMIGDRLDNDIAPAKSVGMRTIRVLSGPFCAAKPETLQQAPDYEASTLSDIPALLEKLN